MEKMETKYIDTSGYDSSITELDISVSTTPSQAPTETTVVEIERKHGTRRTKRG